MATEEEKAAEKAVKEAAKAAEAEAKAKEAAEKAAAKEKEKAEKEAAKAASDAAKAKKTEVVVEYLDHAGVPITRTFSKAVHGEDFEALAKEFCETNATRKANIKE